MYGSLAITIIVILNYCLSYSWITAGVTLLIFDTSPRQVWEQVSMAVIIFIQSLYA